MNKSSADSSCSPDSSASQNIFRTKNCKPTRFAIACGGTGGHMYPGVAVANALKAKGSEVALVLSGRAVEGNRPAGWDGEVISVPCMQPHFKSPLLAFASLVSLVKSFFIALIRFRKFRPHALLAMGSYTSFGPVLAARISGTAVVLHDSNAIPGVAVSKLSHFARIVCVAFDEAVRYLPVSVNTTNTGMPIRMDITEQDPGEYADPSRFTILVMGGSQGAKKLNKKVADAIALLDKDPGEASALRIIHLAGRKNEAEVRSLYGRISNIPVEVIGYSNEMGKLYAASQFCISRAGASSCFELAACGLPALLVPLPGAARNHQLANAGAMNSDGSCDFMTQSELTSEKLASYIRSIRTDSEKLASMSSALLARARPCATDALVFVLEAAGTIC